MNDRERDLLRKTILDLIQRGYNRWTKLERMVMEKRVYSPCLSFVTTNMVRRQFYGYLVVEGFVERVRRGTYMLTEKGRMLLAVLSLEAEVDAFDDEIGVEKS